MKEGKSYNIVKDWSTSSVFGLSIGTEQRNSNQKDLYFVFLLLNPKKNVKENYIKTNNLNHLTPVLHISKNEKNKG